MAAQELLRAAVWYPIARENPGVVATDEARFGCGRSLTGRCRLQGPHQWVLKRLAGGPMREKRAFEFSIPETDAGWAANPVPQAGPAKAGSHRAGVLRLGSAVRQPDWALACRRCCRPGRGLPRSWPRGGWRCSQLVGSLALCARRCCTPAMGQHQQSPPAQRMLAPGTYSPSPRIAVRTYRRWRQSSPEDPLVSP